MRKPLALSGGPYRFLKEVYDRLYRFYGPQGWWPGRTRLEIIVGAILTQNTSWKNVEKAIRNLKTARALSSPVKIKSMGKARLASLIKPAGYYNVKSKRLKNFIDFLFKKYGGDLARVARQDTAELRAQLLGVNGIGPETCDSILLYAFGRPVFVVDAYTKRVFSRHGLVESGAGYHEVQEFFTRNLPKSERLYNEYHALIVRLAKDFCRPNPRCATCVLKENRKSLANMPR